MINCSFGLGTGGSVLIAPSLKARSTPWGLCKTGNSTACSLSSSFISSISSSGSSEMDKVLSPSVKGFQYRTTSTMSPLPILGIVISSFLAPFSFRNTVTSVASKSPSFLTSQLTSRNVLTNVSDTGNPYSLTPIPLLNIRSGAGGSLSTSTVLRTSSEKIPSPLTTLTEIR